MQNSRTVMLFAGFAMLNYIISPAASSAIPMWEFLSRDEKMSHLFRMFSTQVAKFCTDSPRPDCNKNLLVSGVRSLASMDDNLLDKLDPYQHGAKEMIWRAIVGSGRFAARVGQDTDESYFTTGAEALATGGSETNGLGDESISTNDYSRPSSEHSGPYLVGPMVIRVYPDGRPVPEDSARPLPRDEDVEDFRYVRIPSIEEIEADGSNFYGKPKKDVIRRPSLVGNNRRRPLLTQPPEHARVRDISPPYEKRLLQEAPNSSRRIHYY